MQVKLLVSSRTTTTELIQHEPISWILYKGSTKSEVSRMNLDPINPNLLISTRIKNEFVLLFRKIPKHHREEHLWSWIWLASVCDRLWRNWDWTPIVLTHYMPWLMMTSIDAENLLIYFWTWSLTTLRYLTELFGTKKLFFKLNGHINRHNFV